MARAEDYVDPAFAASLAARARARLPRLQAALARARARRQRADEVATRATIRLSDAEEAEARVHGRLLRAEHDIGLHAETVAICAWCRELRFQRAAAATRNEP